MSRHIDALLGVSIGSELTAVNRSALTIAALNQQFMGRDGPTDVLSFPIEDEVIPSGRFPDSGTAGPGMTDEPGEAPILLLGDVVICPTVAARNAAEHKVALRDELALLVVHGVLHLLGWDHVVDAEAERMEARERHLLERFHRPTGGS